MASTHTTKPTRITATQLARSLSDVLNRVRYKGERFEIERNGETIAILESIDPRPKRTLGELIEDVTKHPSGDPSFADDLERIQAEQPPAEFHQWPS